MISFLSLELELAQKRDGSFFMFCRKKYLILQRVVLRCRPPGANPLPRKQDLVSGKCAHNDTLLFSAAIPNLIAYVPIVWESNSTVYQIDSISRLNRIKS